MTPNQAATIRSNPAAVLRRAWSWMRQVSGDAAYENYLRCARRETSRGVAAGRARPLSPAEFYLDSLHRRYSTPSRCC